LATWDGLRFVLPKTYDADVLTRKLRAAVSEDPAVVIDPAGHMAIERAPAGLVREGSGRELDLSSTPVSWVAAEDGKGAARVTVTRKSRLIERKTGDKVRTVRSSSSTAASELVRSLESADPASKPARVRTSGDGLVRDRVTWTSRSPDGALVAHQRAFLALDDWMYEIDLQADPAWSARSEDDGVFDQFLAGFQPQRESALDLEAGELYEARFGWTAPHEFNAFVSLGTSIAFALLMLLIARWRLARIDF
jgi:hypothetical protein